MKMWYVYAHGGFIGTVTAKTKGAALRKARARWLETPDSAITVRSNRGKKKQSASKRISAALSRFLKKQNPAKMRGVTHVRIKKLKDGGITISPVRKVKR